MRNNHQRVDIRAKFVPDTDKSTEGPIKISMDYMYLHDRVGKDRDSKWNPPYLVVVEHRHGRIWAYQTLNKGPNDDASWLPARLIQDWDDCGFKEVVIQLKTDQEPSMINLQAAIQSQRPKGIIPVNSPVGESESNGRVENAIRRVQEKTRALRHQLESNIKQKILGCNPIMSWLVRWAAEVLSKYSCGDDGKSPHERLHGEKCATPLVPFGESVLYLPLKTVRRDKGDVAKRPGIWLGIIARTQEVLIGTEQGVVKCKTVTRLSDEDRWNTRQTLKMKGTPWEPVPGKIDRRIPVAIDNQGNGVQPVDDEDLEKEPREGSDDEGQNVEFRGGPDKFHVSRKAIERYGPTEGCPACTIITTRGITTGRVGVHHNNTCRERVVKAMKVDPQYRQLMQKHHGNVDVIQHHNCEQNNNNDNNNNNTIIHDNHHHKLAEQRGHVRKALHTIQQKMAGGENSITSQLDQTMMKILIASMDVAEFYSPPRIIEMARTMGLRAGWSMDLTTRDTDGRAWDFNIPEMRNRAARRIVTDKPPLVIGSPLCTVYSAMNNINHARMATEVVQERFAYARKHLECATKLYMLQIQGGRYFLHEHPASASSWSEACIKEVMSKKGVTKVIGDQCRYGLVSEGKEGQGPAKKPTGFMTNSPCIALQLQRRCPNKGGYKVHEHVQLEDGRARAAQVCPPGLCKAVCKGLIEQMNADRNGQYLLGNIKYDEECTSKELLHAAKQLEKKYKTVEEDDTEELEIAWDDVSGAELDPKKDRKAREEEIQYVRTMDLYEKVPIIECYNATGKAPISIRWIDINKGDNVNINYRSRLVAREINIHKRDDLFAATPPLEALELILSMTTTGNRGETIMVNDISRAFFHAKAKREVFVRLPKEDIKPGEEKMCGKLKYSMYGTRDAAQNWYQEYSSQLVKIGFVQGKASPCVFHHPDRGIRTYVHGDDYVSTAKPEQLQWMRTQLEKKYSVKTETLGPGPNDKKQIKFLNRIVTWHDTEGISYEVDPRHIEIILKQLQLTEAKIVTTPGTKEEGRTSEDHKTELTDKEATLYRALVARCNYLSRQTRYLLYSERASEGHVEANTRGYAPNEEDGKIFKRNTKSRDAISVAAHADYHDDVQ